MNQPWIPLIGDGIVTNDDNIMNIKPPWTPPFRDGIVDLGDIPNLEPYKISPNYVTTPTKPIQRNIMKEPMKEPMKVNTPIINQNYLYTGVITPKLVKYLFVKDFEFVFIDQKENLIKVQTLNNIKNVIHNPEDIFLNGCTYFVEYMLKNYRIKFYTVNNQHFFTKLNFNGKETLWKPNLNKIRNIKFIEQSTNDIPNCINKYIEINNFLKNLNIKEPILGTIAFLTTLYLLNKLFN